ncbi:ribosome-releasing factor 2, mitochondrial [Tribolium castaneum]|uniref:Elongation factor G2 n=1 Tax=Tribolium castaneum TaxID=7070 RepID=D6WPX8_TRICA|nr:PREDICTED: ribosome-releasing factor 2, mitochondrial [Tribolium castaneum]EFA06892.2 Ribosome-releasing factor 2, mitochondrial-like Protein [Tribolium castaneum]|eukprot:XP_973240.2 PREDICTED: ribosome-releasing factor 2, mitochondrial [Tribolium castaneum]
MFSISARAFFKPRLVKYFRYSSTKKKFEDVDVSKIRNIGILAHIDAGKTTTTERMLYYSGLINQMGEVHHGNTVTDFMDQERERGITITSAAVTFYWKNYQFNLIDTPGHIDFTMEVEQTLNVLDGAVVVLDGSAGVEAQTLTVWRQADRYKIPRIVFVNKMDRSDSNLFLSCKSIEEKLEVPVLCLQLPVIENGVLTGIVDVLTLEKITYDRSNDKLMSRVEITKKSDPELWEDARRLRSHLVDVLSTFDDSLANLVISSESFDITTVDIIKALRSVTLKQKAVPVLMGSAYKNIGIQPLMDSILLYLPSPSERDTHFSSFEENLCARAFKVRHDKQKGPLTFFRIYNGKFNKNQRIYSIQQEQTEQCGKLYVAYADDFKEVDSIGTGNIAVVSGLKYVMSGDLVTNSQSSAQKAKARMLKLTKKKGEIDEESVESLFGTGPRIPEPVFFCSIEPPSLAYQNALEQALTELQREDPSLRVTHDTETGQTVLSGMGELHLEIIKDRILKEYKIDADLGPLQIAYLESPVNKVTESLLTDTKIANNKQMVNVKLSLIPVEKSGGDLMKLDKSPDAASNIANIFPKHLLAIKQGIEVGVAHGPKIGSRVVNVEVMLHMFEVGRGTSESVIAATVTQLVQKLVQKSGTNVLEPIMHLEIAAPDEYVSSVMGDLARRRSEIQNVSVRGNMKVVEVMVPLAELMGYSTVLRTITSGTATFTMEFGEYRVMTAVDEENAIRSVRGF